MTREQKIAAATRMRESGLPYEVIAARLGVGSGTPWKWLHPERTAEWVRRDNADPRTRERKDRYDRTTGRGTCSICGGPMGVSSAHRYSRCQGCYRNRGES